MTERTILKAVLRELLAQSEQAQTLVYLPSGTQRMRLLIDRLLEEVPPFPVNESLCRAQDEMLAYDREKVSRITLDQLTMQGDRIYRYSGNLFALPLHAVLVEGTYYQSVFAEKVHAVAGVRLRTNEVQARSEVGEEAIIQASGYNLHCPVLHLPAIYSEEQLESVYREALDRCRAQGLYTLAMAMPGAFCDLDGQKAVQLLEQLNRGKEFEIILCE